MENEPVLVDDLTSTGSYIGIWMRG